MTVPIWFNHLDAECPECGYNLRGLVQTTAIVCPECGRAWQPEQLMLPDSARRLQWRPLMLALLPGLLAGFVFLLGHPLEGSRSLGRITEGVVTTSLVLLTVFGPVWILFCALDAVPLVWRRRRALAAVAIGLVLIVVNIGLFALFVLPDL